MNCPFSAKQLQSTFPEIMPNLMPKVKMRQTHVLKLSPGYCPVSKEPHLESELRLSYDACNGHIEVMQLRAFVDSLIGGKKYEDGTHIRELEQLIQFIAQRYADLLDVAIDFQATMRISFGDVILEGTATPARLMQMLDTFPSR